MVWKRGGGGKFFRVEGRVREHSCLPAHVSILHIIIIIITWYFQSGLSSNATTRTTSVSEHTMNILSTARIAQRKRSHEIESVSDESDIWERASIPRLKHQCRRHLHSIQTMMSATTSPSSENHFIHKHTYTCST